MKRIPTYLAVCAVLGAASVGSAAAHPAGYFKTERFHGVSFQYGSSLSRQILARIQPRAAGIDLLPRRIDFSFRDYIVSPDINPDMIVMRVSNLSPADRAAARQVRALILTHANLQGRKIPYLLGEEGSYAFYARQQYVHFANGHGITFITEFTLGKYTAITHLFWFMFEGVTNDGKYAIACQMPLSAPSAATYSPKPKPSQRRFNATVKRLVPYFNRVSDTATVPYMSNLLKIFRTLRVHPRGL